MIEPSSLLCPPDSYDRVSDQPPVYSIDAASLSQALEYQATQPLPDTKEVFPWLHGLHADNQVQLAFFLARRRSNKKIPTCIRGITIVKTGGDLTKSRLKGAIGPDEVLLPLDRPNTTSSFIDADPRDGFSVRNFQIQAAKMATISDVVIYGDEYTPKSASLQLARKFAQAQETWRRKQIAEGSEPHSFHTFLVSDKFSTFETSFPELVAIDSSSRVKDSVFDFFLWERKEMCEMSKATEISHNVFLGPTPDPAVVTDGRRFDVYVECADLAALPTDSVLQAHSQTLLEANAVVRLDCASSGSILTPNWNQSEVDSLMAMCHWMYTISHGERDSKTDEDEAECGHDRDHDNDSIMSSAGSVHSEETPSNKRILLHCGDGYTETSLLALTYFMYTEGLPAHEAWLRLHYDKKREFFAYPTDVALLAAIQPRILQESPKRRGESPTSTLVQSPPWFSRMDGSLPSRILPYMYLGNLNHANNPHLLKELGITQILSVGEPLNWTNGPNRLSEKYWPKENLLFIDNVQDNGVDPLTNEFPRCLAFIAKGRASGGATLVHCRVGVSRSATICIAEVMREKLLSFPRAYTYVRARRLNVIIQPHLRFTYELLKWEEEMCVRSGRPVKRELEWATIAREIARMNRAYAR